MRRVRYAVAASLNGFIAGPNGEADWIIMDPAFDFDELYKQFDTMLLGRRTFEAMGPAGSGSMPGMKTFVSSRTLEKRDHPKVMIIDDACRAVAEMRKSAAKDIWLFGGGSLFRSLAEAKLVDTVEVAVMPVLLGTGIPLFASPADSVTLRLTGHKIYGTGVVSLECAVVRRRPRATSKSA